MLAQIGADGDFSWVLPSIKWIIEQFYVGNSAPAIAMIVMISVYVLYKLLSNKISASVLPYISMSMGIISACATNLLAVAIGCPQRDWITAIITGLTVGAAASGFWSQIGKLFIRWFDSLYFKITTWIKSRQSSD